MSSENQGQAAFWNGDVGRRWIGEQAAIESAFAPVTACLLERSDIGTRHAVLEVGCGTGAVVRAIASAGARATGIDISPVMIEHAARVPGADFICGDAQDWEFGQRYDRIVSRFGVMFFADPVAAFSNLRRSLNDKGQIHFVAWGPLAQNPWFALPRRIAVERLGAPPPSDSRAPGPMAFADGGRVVDILKRAGLGNPSFEPLSVALTPNGDADDLARHLTSLGPVSSVMRDRGGEPKDLDAIREAIRRECRTFQTQEGLRIPSVMNYFRAEI